MYFSTTGNLRGELAIWDIKHRQLVTSWMAHKRTAVTCVNFSNDTKHVYSCGQDAKVGFPTPMPWLSVFSYTTRLSLPPLQVIVWDWRTSTKLALLSGHHSPVVCQDMSLDGSKIVSGDKDGIVIIWNAETQRPVQVSAVEDSV